MPLDGGKPGKVMPEEDILAVIGREMASAIGQDGDQFSADREAALRYYEGELPKPPEQDGRSKAVSRNVLEAVEWVLPVLLRLFVASDKIAIIEPTKPGQIEEDAATQATDYLTQIFYKDNDGFMLLHDWFKDGLLQRLGWVKRWWQEEIVQETDSYTGITREEYDALLTPADGAEVKVLKEEETTLGTGETRHDCTLQTTREESRICLENVPPEEVWFSPKCRRGYMPFVCHRRMRTFSDLLQEGYDEEAIRESLGPDESVRSSEALLRQLPEQSDPLQNDRPDEAMQEVAVEESYLLLDYNQDGIAELCKVTTVFDASRVLLTKDGKPDCGPVDEIPLEWLGPVPMPHKLVGKSLADLVQDLQEIKTAIIRGMLDSLYLAVNGRTVVADDAANENTYDDVLNSRPGGIIRARRADGIVPLIQPFVGADAFPMVEYLDQTQEARTGVARHNQGLNPDDLNKTATGISLLQQAAAQRVELIGRIFGGRVKALVEGILGLVRRHQQQARVIQVTGKWVPMDPRQWRSKLDVSVDVGLGTGNRDQIIQHLMTILQIQNGMVQLQKGINGPLVYAQNVYDVAEKLTENAGFKESFFANPSEPPPPGAQPQQPQPDPEMAKAQAQMQIAAQKAQTDAALNDRKAQQQMTIDQEKARQEMVLAEQQMQHRMQLEQRDADNRFVLEQQKLQNEMELARMRTAAEIQRAREQPESEARA